MARLIDADALILALETQDYSGSPESLEDWTPQDLTKAEIVDINNAPTIEAEPVRHGHWIKFEKIYPEKMNDTTYAYLCSECHHSDVHSAFIRVRYCWNCGALMDLKEVKAESVVRCKDCILDRETQCPMKYGTDPDDYCSWGERMDGA